MKNSIIGRRKTRELVVQFLFQNEFNPMHDHTGTYSFVIWLKIPTNFKEQSNNSLL